MPEYHFDLQTILFNLHICLTFGIADIMHKEKQAYPFDKAIFTLLSHAFIQFNLSYIVHLLILKKSLTEYGEMAFFTNYYLTT
jgi:hypothetical protein